MEIRQFVAEALGDASYLVASGGEAALVDPQRDIRPYIDAAAELGVTIRYVFETHVHNDYISGGPELATLGATIVAPRDGGLVFAHQAVIDGDEVSLGSARIRAVHAPGHTHHHTAYLAIDEHGAITAAFTGGSIIIGGAGRTDLLGPAHTDQLTRLQWESAQRLSALLPEEAELLPTHGTGSFCATQGGGDDRRALLSEERPRNVLLASPNFESFRTFHLANPGPIPAYYQHMAAINQAGARLYGPTLPHPPLLTPADVDRYLERHVPVLDVRDRVTFAEAHVPSSISVEEDGSMLAYVSWVTPFNSELVLVVEDAAQAERVSVDLLRIGYEQTRGYLPFESWLAGWPVATLETVDVSEASRIYEDRSAPVYDVRFDSDRRDLDLPHSHHHPVDQITSWLPAVGHHAPLLVCGSGSRATTVGSILQARGRNPRVLVDGGAADLVETPATTQS